VATADISARTDTGQSGRTVAGREPLPGRARLSRLGSAPKRAAKPALSAWWQQACDQASNGLKPALAYRLDRHPWRFVVALRHIASGFENAPLALRLETDLEVFTALVRETERW